MTPETRTKISKAMRGNKNATGGTAFRFRPGVCVSNALGKLIDSRSAPFEYTWHSHGYIGISTDDPKVASEWSKRVRSLGYKVKDWRVGRVVDSN